MRAIYPEQLTDAKHGDERALAGVFSRMMPRVQYGAVCLSSQGIDEEDMVQEGLIGLMHAIDTYDASKGVWFETYAASCIQNAQITALRAAQRKKHGPLNSSVPLSAGEVQTVPGPEELTIQQEGLAQWQARFRSQLTDREQQVLVSFLNGESHQEIAEKIGCTSKAVESALARARRKLRPFL